MSDFPPLDVIPVGAGHGPAEKRSDPDDVQSMVRLLLYTNDLDVEGLVASAGTLANVAKKQNILDVLNLYDQVDQGGWGGKFVRRDPARKHWLDDPAGAQTVWRWRREAQRTSPVVPSG